MPMMIQGREHYTYDELLDLAHNRGLLSIETDLRQTPSDENGRTAIATARTTWLDKDGNHRVFCGVGDANPTNVNKMIANHSIRMAETRAKARALRDALNIKGASFEELGGDESAGATPTEAKQQAAPAQAQGEDAIELIKKVRGRMWGAVKSFYGGTEDEAKAAFRTYLAENYTRADGQPVQSTTELTVEQMEAITKAFVSAAKKGA